MGKRIAVLGLGFVGLTTALGFAHNSNNTVIGCDIDTEKVSLLKNGKIPFYEPFLEEKLKVSNNLTIVSNLGIAVSEAEVIFYCVGTPSKENGDADLGILMNAIKRTLDVYNNREFKTLVIKSTVPPSTTQEKIKPLIEEKGLVIGEDIGLVNNPEFLREGTAWEDFINPDRIVIGESDKRSGDIVAELYSMFDTEIYRVSLNTGEYIKYLSNTLLATMISFSNEMAMIADVVGDIEMAKAFKVLHADRRWSGNPSKMADYVYPGCGFGGYCLPKDTSAMYKLSIDRKQEAGLLREVIIVNEKIKNHMVDRIANEVGRDDVVGILGLSFKPGSDDIRSTPANYIIEALLQKGYKKIFAYDPMAMENFHNTYNLPVHYCNSMEDLVYSSDLCMVLTAWKEFNDKKEIIKTKKFIDGRNYLFN